MNGTFRPAPYLLPCRFNSPVAGYTKQHETAAFCTDGTNRETQKVIEVKLKVKSPVGQNMPECSDHIVWTYEGWNFNSGNYLFTTDTK